MNLMQAKIDFGTVDRPYMVHKRRVDPLYGQSHHRFPVCLNSS